MGYCYAFHCDHCGYNETILYEIGMMFPQTYQEVLSAVKAGDYGDEMKKASTETPGIAVDAEWYLYVCPCCGTWRNDYGLTLYEPNDPVHDERDYVTMYEIQNNYHVKRRYIHKCPSCGKRMRRYREGDQPVCPKCHHVGHIKPEGLWD